MAAEKLDGSKFDQARAMYEGIRSVRVGEMNQDAVHREVSALVESNFPGFCEEWRRREDDRRGEVDRSTDGSVIKKDGGRETWYGGSRELVGEWPSYRDRLIQGGMTPEAVKGIHRSTERLMGLCANPKRPGDRRKGLVIGHVQSGKTANFTGLIAKAVDEGYRIIVVLAGMYTNLRVQTQQRLQKDLGIDIVEDGAGIAWHRLTSPAADIGSENSPGFLSTRSNVALIVVKKHEARLANATGFLRSIPDEILDRRAVLVIDDESDQATPNTRAAAHLVSTINNRVRDLWAAVRTGTYVAYTATPFANVFIDPEVPGDLYPEDFIVTLPRPEGYMGSEAFFDVLQSTDGTEDESIYELAHEVPVDEAGIFTPALRDTEGFSPEMVPSLETAVRWFLLATAIRELRTGQRKDSSMLIHSSQRVVVHQRTKEVVAAFISDLALAGGSEEHAFRSVFDAEIGRAESLRDGESVPAWQEVWRATRRALEDVVVKIDNGESTDRLVYDSQSPQTVIAIGGGTLSRGLTLEGLVVSYFLRSSSTYDTLLQMGRWFGFRPGYRDLVRLWMGPGLLEEYRHLARVERDLRDEVGAMESEGRTPRDYAIKVRSHPGRLEITSKSKMSAADLVRAGLGGTRRQTIYLDRSRAAIDDAQAAARRLVEATLHRGGGILPAGVQTPGAAPSLLLRGAASRDLVEFLRSYWVAPAERWLQPGAMGEWIERRARSDGDIDWNLVLVSGPNGSGGAFRYGRGAEVGLTRRTPLRPELWSPDRLDVDLPERSDIVNIRALMSSQDYLLDLRILADHGALSDEDARLVRSAATEDFAHAKAVRSVVRPNEGAIILYAIDGNSQPRPDSKTRAPMDAEGVMIGLATVFPHAPNEDDGEFWSVSLPELDADGEDEVELTQRDDEGDFGAGSEA